MVITPSAVWGEHIYIYLYAVGWGRVKVWLLLWQLRRESRSCRGSTMPCVCGHRTSFSHSSIFSHWELQQQQCLYSLW